MAYMMNKRSTVISSRPARILVIVAFVWLLGPASRGWAQTYLQNVGVPTFATNIPVENGSVNAANGNLHLEIPLGSFPQRGGSTLRVALMYDSAIWLPGTPIPGSWSWNNIYQGPRWSGFTGWRLVTSEDPGYITSGQTETGYCSKEDDYVYIQYHPWIWAAADGKLSPV